MAKNDGIIGSMPMRVLLQLVNGILLNDLLWRKLFQNKPQGFWPPFRSPLPHLYFSLSHTQAECDRKSPGHSRVPQAHPPAPCPPAPRPLGFCLVGPGITVSIWSSECGKWCPCFCWLAHSCVTQMVMWAVMHCNSNGWRVTRACLEWVQEVLGKKWACARPVLVRQNVISPLSPQGHLHSYSQDISDQGSRVS